MTRPLSTSLACAHGQPVCSLAHLFVLAALAPPLISPFSRLLQIRTYPGPYVVPFNFTIPFFIVNRLNAELLNALVTGDPPLGQAPGLGTQSFAAYVTTPPIKSACIRRHHGFVCWLVTSLCEQ